MCQFLKNRVSPVIFPLVFTLLKPLFSLSHSINTHPKTGDKLKDQKITPTINSLKIIRPTELSELLSLSLVSIWRMEKRGELPPRIKISKRAVGWRESDIEAWLNERQQDKEAHQNNN